MKKFSKTPFGIWFLSWLLNIYGRLVWITCRKEYEGRAHLDAFQDAGKPFAIAAWHGRLMLVPYMLQSRKQTVYALASKHGDGELIALWMTRLGMHFIRGSSSSGGARALIEMRRRAAEGAVIAVTPDGPRGPRMRVKNGIVVAAQASNIPIVATSYSSPSAKMLSSWDRQLLLKPFSKVFITIGAPVAPPASRDAADIEACRLQLEETMIGLQQRADALAGRDPVAAADPEEGAKKKRRDMPATDKQQA